MFSDVMRSMHDGNVILAVRKYGNKTAIGIISTRYFVELGKSISFGSKGHAAIVDASGNVLAHPLDSWIEARKNIAQVSAVKRMLNGETGIEQFYSPALKGDMIAGLTSVKGPGWGVMIPQPVEELYQKVNANHKSIAYVFGIGIILALLLSGLFLEAVATPLEQLLRNMLNNAKTRTLTNSDVVPGLLVVKEINQLNLSYNTMVRRVSASHSRIEQMAYSDPVTGLPNRRRLEVLATEAFGVQGEGVSLGAIVQVNIDNFKEINDLHGHKVGDKFLKMQAKRMQNFLKSIHPGTTNQAAGSSAAKRLDKTTVSVARLGGDEFVMLIPNLTEPDENRNTISLLNKFMATPSKELPNVTQCGVSIGVARYPFDGTNLSELLRKTDIALNVAKSNGKNCGKLYDNSVAALGEAQIRQDVEIGHSRKSIAP